MKHNLKNCLGKKEKDAIEEQIKTFTFYAAKIHVITSILNWFQFSYKNFLKDIDVLKVQVPEFRDISTVLRNPHSTMIAKHQP